MPKVEAETGAGVQTVEAAQGRKLTLALEDAGIDILHRCGGNAKCTTCRVEILEGDAGEMNNAERERLARETGLAENTRLSCQVRVAGDMRVRVLRQLSTSGLPDPGPRPAE
jgi:ferredoxin